MNILFKPQNISVDVEPGTTVMQALITAGLKIDAPCGGRGVCGKCKVRIVDGAEEKTVLACQTEINSDLVVDISKQDEGHRILMGGLEREVKLESMVYSVTVNVPQPSTSDLRSCWERLTEAVADKLGFDKGEITPNPLVAANLYKILEDNDYLVEVMLFNRDIIDVKPPQSDMFALAYDIGTTTVAAYLIDLKTGRSLTQASLLNPQVKYGADVIMRTKYAIENGHEAMAKDIRGALSELCDKCLKEAGKKAESVYLITVVGNTCMHHLFLGISPASLAYAPYTAAITEPVTVNASDYGFNVNPCARISVLPNIAGFVGADTVGASLAVEMDKKDELTLMIDIGTNGEMVLGDKNRLIACSTAAGPAFEGAVITHGMRGAEGAIDHITLKDGKLDYSVIGDVKPRGICGSGIIDLVSELVRVGLVDSGGRLLMGDEITSPEGSLYNKYIEVIDGLRCFLLADEKESGSGEKIVFTQKDVREVQLAKGAMAAGIQMMSIKLGTDVNDIKSIMIAGAFGSYMSPKSACGIGLIPPRLEGKVKAVGNAAGREQGWLQWAIPSIREPMAYQIRGIPWACRRLPVSGCICGQPGVSFPVC